VFFTMGDRDYNGETQVSIIIFLIQLYEMFEENKTTGGATRRKNLSFFYRRIKSTMMDEWEEGADQQLNEHWEIVLARAKDECMHVSEMSSRSCEIDLLYQF
jgi:hypothetical protein